MNCKERGLHVYVPGDFRDNRFPFLFGQHEIKQLFLKCMYCDYTTYGDLTYELKEIQLNEIGKTQN